MRRHIERERMVKFIFGKSTTLVDMINFNVNIKSLRTEGIKDEDEKSKALSRMNLARFSRQEKILLFGDDMEHTPHSWSSFGLIKKFNSGLNVMMVVKL